VRRVGWLAALAQTMAAQVLTERWTGAALTDLASGKSGDGRPLPAKGWMAVRRLGWGCTTPVVCLSADYGSRAGTATPTRYV
jgi:hypothetical protein